MRSTRRAFTVARLTATHNGRAASLALVDTLNMAAVAAATSASALRDARWALADAPALEGTPEAVGQIQAAAVVHAAARRVAVLTHVGVSAHAFVLHVPDNGGLCRVMGAVLTREDALQVRRPRRSCLPCNHSRMHACMRARPPLSKAAFDRHLTPGIAIS